MLLKNKQVAILGAGPVGLTMARLLQQQGIDVTVYERDENTRARIWGGTLDLHGDSGQKALEKAGLLESYYNLAMPMGRTLTNEQGKVQLTVNPAADAPEINRNDLRILLLNSLASNTVVWNRKFTGIEPHNGKWLLHFENQPDAMADLVVGANGGMSNARKFITDAKAEYTGTLFVQGEITEPQINCPEFFQLCNGNILMIAYNGNLLVANPKNNGLLTYNVIFGATEEWLHDNGPDFQNAGSISSFLSGKLSDWDELYKQLFRATSSFRELPIKKLPLDKPWKTNRPLPITLIGDAAHLMPPFAGQGVNIGLVDALILSGNLTSGKFETIEAAISDYERQMLVYATEAQIQSDKNEKEMRDPGFSFMKFFH